MKKLIPSVMLILISILLSSCVWRSARVYFEDYEVYRKETASWKEPDSYSFVYSYFSSDDVPPYKYYNIKLKVIKNKENTEYEICEVKEEIDEDSGDVVSKEETYSAITREEFVSKYSEEMLFSSITDIYKYFDKYYADTKNNYGDFEVGFYAHFYFCEDVNMELPSWFGVSYSPANSFGFMFGDPPRGGGIHIDITDFAILE